MRLIKPIKITKQRFWLCLIFCLVATLLSFHWAEAGLGTIIINATKFIVLGALAASLMVAISLSLGFFKLSEIILAWAVNPELLGNITDSDFVMTAWELVRDFSNMFLILIVVAIGIATALRIKEYEVKKTLPRLIAVALLINFSPVICGLVIDAANIFINFFLTAGAAGFSEAINLSTTVGDFYKNAMKDAWGNWEQFWNGVFFFRSLGVLVFNILGGLILMLFAILFLIRNVALWLLVILSPLAFLAYVLPATKKAIFDRWRKEFVQWTFIGVVGTFFIYLTQLMLSVQIQQIKDNAPPTESIEFGHPGISALIVMAVPLLFMIIGYFVTISSSAAGAKSVISFAKRGGKWTKSKAGRKLRSELSQRAAEPIKEKLGGWASRVGKEKPKKWKGVPAKEKAKLPFYWARQRVAKRVLKGTAEAQTKELQKLIEEDKKLTSEGRTLETRTAKSDVAKIAAVIAKMEKGETNDLTKEEIKKAIATSSKIHGDIVNRIITASPDIALETARDYTRQAEAARQRGNLNEAAKILKRMDQMGLVLSKEDRDKGYESLADKLADKIKPSQIPSLRTEALADEEYRASALKFWRGNQYAVASRELGRVAVDEIQKGIDEIGEERLKTEYPALHKFSESSAAAALGLRKSKNIAPDYRGWETLESRRREGARREESLAGLRKILKAEEETKKPKGPRGRPGLRGRKKYIPGRRRRRPSGSPGYRV